MGGWTAATEVQQEMFSHFALISVELANSFWPMQEAERRSHRRFQLRSALRSACRTFPSSTSGSTRKGSGLPGCLFVQLVQLLLRQQGAELFDDGAQLVLVAQPPAAEELDVDPHDCADEPQLLRAHPGADLHVTASDEERVRPGTASSSPTSWTPR